MHEGLWGASCPCYDQLIQLTGRPGGGVSALRPLQRLSQRAPEPLPLEVTCWAEQRWVGDPAKDPALCTRHGLLPGRHGEADCINCSEFCIFEETVTDRKSVV